MKGEERRGEGGGGELGEEGKGRVKNRAEAKARSLINQKWVHRCA